MLGFICVVHCVWSFQVDMFNATPADISRFWSILGILEPFAFSVCLFCHPFGGRDSLKKRKIHEDIIHTLQHTATHCNALQRTATNPTHSRGQGVEGLLKRVIKHNSHVATHCNSLQHTATNLTHTQGQGVEGPLKSYKTYERNAEEVHILEKSTRYQIGCVK